HLPPALEHHHGVLGLLARDACRQLVGVVPDELERAAAVALAQPTHAGLAHTAVGVVDDDHGRSIRPLPTWCHAGELRDRALLVHFPDDRARPSLRPGAPTCGS